MFSSIQTTVCAASKIVVTPVKFRWHSSEITTGWIVTQRLELTGHDDQRYSIDIHLEEDCNALMTGEPVAFPLAQESTGASA